MPTLKEGKIEVSIGAWRGLAAPKGTSPEVIAILRAATRKAAEETSLKESLDKLNLGYAYADADAFRATMQKDSDMFKQLIAKLGLKA